MLQVHRELQEQLSKLGALAEAREKDNVRAERLASDATSEHGPAASLPVPGLTSIFDEVQANFGRYGTPTATHPD